MKRKIYFTAFAVAIAVGTSSCSIAEQIYDETMQEIPGSGEDTGDSSFLDKLFERNIESWTPTTIVEDAKNKMDWELSSDVVSEIREYAERNRIRRSLTEEEILELAEAADAKNFLMDSTLVVAAFDELKNELGADELYIHEANLYVQARGIQADIVDPNNPQHVDTYNYFAGGVNAPRWENTPKVVDDYSAEGKTALDFAVPLSEINFGVIDTMRAHAVEILKANGMERDHDYAGRTDFGMGNVYVGFPVLAEEEIIFRSGVNLPRGDVDLRFDNEGNRIEEN
ncbi:hypothetical protein [Trueperella bialowiezensis]|uniref:Uncharacterized protein n=1 Tax=Trueperella bialowiezensis TaxID=312285 RepID=A0A448PF14_9ACTO|nr:hypothetical protein [Trueperella bialowiezensis]VEI13517.1 Uncharacterised protein [Trueperella bialowiezensis]